MTEGQKRLAVIGSPIKQSLSPRIHAEWLAHYNIDAHYDAIEVKAEDLHEFCAALKENDWRGCNVTIPHKENVLAHLDEIDASAQRIGAVNTIVNRNGKLIGYNTDGFGFVAHLHTEQPDYDFSKPVVILGAGGAARGILNALLEQGTSQITLVNRDTKKAEKLRQDFNHADIQICDWNNYSTALLNAGLLVNTTSLGMSGQPDLAVDLSALPNDAVVYDIVYKPLETNLLRQAAQLNLKTIDGLGMLLHQARQSFYHWFGILPEGNQKLRSMLEAAII